jgi:hypothetical protein
MRLISECRVDTDAVNAEARGQYWRPQPDKFRTEFRNGNLARSASSANVYRTVGGRLTDG